VIFLGNWLKWGNLFCAVWVLLFFLEVGNGGASG
jgi:hypothetical protein